MTTEKRGIIAKLGHLELIRDERGLAMRILPGIQRLDAGDVALLIELLREHAPKPERPSR